ncbi:MAG: nucleotide exchange factor GrpE [Thermoplasmata archaeon]|nr:nucleotide exchange factor GrpE [Thermoplasmata archaeon]MCI4337770.1 nucleotide exchange factor GrpE [Thermoplasmata archaeon]
MTDAENPGTEAPPPPPAPPVEAVEPAAPEPDWATQYKYLLAEFDNFRKRTEREREQRGRDARALVLRELLPFYDALGKASESVRSLAETDPVRRGFELLLREWERFLDREEVTAIARAGELFRAEVMEAVGEARASKARPEGTVTEVVQQGYISGARLLRPARVVVARTPPPDPAAPESPAPAPEGSL